jgi:hypothetical protein
MQLGEAKLEVVVADITTLEVEAIVNAANAQLAGAEASTARSIGLQGPNSRRPAAQSAVVRRAKCGSRRVSICGRAISSTPSDRSGAGERKARRSCSLPATAARSRRRASSRVSLIVASRRLPRKCFGRRVAWTRRTMTSTLGRPRNLESHARRAIAACPLYPYPYPLELIEMFRCER